MALLGRGFPVAPVIPDAVVTAGAAVGTLAFVEDDDTIAIAGTTSIITGTFAFVEDDDTVAASGSESITGTLAFTEDDDTVTISSGDILFDDFTGTTVDPTKWVVYKRLQDQVNSEVGADEPANVTVASGILTIASKFETVTEGDSTTGAPNPRSVSYTSGQIAQATAPFLYGSVRVRAKVPGGTGLWPCIWMLGTNWQATQPSTANTPLANWPVGGWFEVDIAEFISGHRTTVNTSLHWNTAGVIDEKTLPFDATTRFMVYRFDWTATSMTWMVDAEDGNGFITLKTVTGAAGTVIPNVPAYLIIHSAVGGSLGGTPDSATFPQSWSVDYAQIQRTAATVDQPAGTLFFTDADDTVAVSGASSIITGALAFVEDDDAVAMSGSTSLTGTLAFTEADDAVAASGAENVAGTVALTEDDDTVAASGTESITGTFAFVEDDDTVAVAGFESIASTLAFTDDDDTIAMSGSVVNTITGTLAFTDDDDVVSMAGGGIVPGTFAYTEDDDTIAASGSELITGTVAALEDDDTVTISGSENIAATLAYTEDDDTVTMLPPGAITGTAAWTEDDDLFLAAAGITILGNIAWTDDDDTLALTGTSANPVNGTIAWTETDDNWVIAAINGSIQPTVITGPLLTRPGPARTSRPGQLARTTRGH